jgi:carboxyl-terminal processing protease
MSRITKAIASLTLTVLLTAPASVPALQNRSQRVSHNGVQHRARIVKDPGRRRREKTFELVWQTVNDENFDPTFGGVNWYAVHSRYAPRVGRTTSDLELHMLLQQMVDEIPQSHFAIIPPDKIPRIKARREGRGKADGREGDETDALLDEDYEGDNEIATQMLNGIGVDVRILNGQVVITRVAEGGPAARAGLRPGFIIKSLDGILLDNVSTVTNLSPMLHMMLRQRILVEYLGGAPGTEVHVAYLDEENKERQSVIKRERLKGTLSSSLGNLPPLYTELEAKRLPGKIGYIRFSVFTPQLAEQICGAVKAMRDAPGLIIDLRGNPGGVMGMASGVVGLLTNRTGLIGIIRTRSGGMPIPTFPQKSSYEGPIVVLIDRLSGSTAEVMAAALQESGRAVVVGERSAGEVLGANIIKLPTGALFEYGRAGFKTSEGATLEGKGVTPDVEKKLERATLLRGIDDQLQEAVRQIELQREKAGKKQPPAVSAPAPPKPVEVAIDDSEENQPLRKEGASNADVRAPAFKSTPEADTIMERYIKAIGGREALSKLKSRVSVGVCTYPFQGLSGKVVIYEQAPDKRSTEIDVPSLGVMRVVYDGKRAWMQNSMMGFYEYKGRMLSDLRRDFDFYKITKYRELYSEMIYKGAIDTAQGRVEILEVATHDGFRDELHFDARTGLLVYGGGTQLSDYRQVGDVKIPFLMVVPMAGLEIRIQLQQVSHNVEIKAEAFNEPKSCFTGQ